MKCFHHWLKQLELALIPSRDILLPNSIEWLLPSIEFNKTKTHKNNITKAKQRKKTKEITSPLPRCCVNFKQISKLAYIWI